MISSITFAPPTRIAPAAPAKPAADAETPRKTTKDYSIARKAVEGTAGLFGGLIGTAVNTLPSAVAGGIEGVSQHMSADDVGVAQTLGVVFESAVGGAVLGGALGGGLGIGIGIAAGLVGGIAYGGLQAESSGAQQIGTRVKATVDSAVGANPPSGSKIKDVTKNLTEGTILGGFAGVGSGFSVGSQEARGVTSGVLEGLKGGFHVIKGDYDTAPQPPAPGPSRSLLSSVLRIPRVVLRTGVGAAFAVAGGVLNTLDGAVQGFGQGADHDYYGSTGLHNGLVRTELFAAGTAAGVVFGAPLVGGVAGGVVGALGGLLVGGVVNRITRKTGADKVAVDYVSNCVKSAAADNAQSDSKVYTTFRDGVEGAIVGSVAGFKGGVRTGWQGGKGAVDGVLDGIKGVVNGILGAFHHPAPGAATKEG